MGKEKRNLSGLDQPLWSQHEVNVIIAEKTAKRAAKGLKSYCYSLDLAARLDKPDEQYNEDNLDVFAKAMFERASCLNPGETIRLQLAVLVNEIHWTAVDLQVSQDGVQLLNIDAFGDELGIRAAETLFYTLAEQYPNYSQESGCFKFIWLKHGSIANTDKVQGIQYDRNSCSVFTLDHLFHIANIDTFSMLAEHDAEFKTYSFDNHLRSFNSSNMPNDFAFLYRNTQSKTAFESLPNDLKEQMINIKGQTLAQSEEVHTETITVYGNTKSHNQAIHHKKQGFIRDANRFFARERDEKKVENRDVLKALDSGSFLQNDDFNKSEVVNSMIEKAKAAHGAKPMRSLSAIYHHLRDGYLLKKAKTYLLSNQTNKALENLGKLSCMTTIFKSQLRQINQNFADQDDESKDQEHTTTSRTRHDGA